MLSVLSLTLNFLSGGTSILLPELGLIISGNFILILLIAVNILYFAFDLSQADDGKSHLPKIWRLLN